MSLPRIRMSLLEAGLVGHADSSAGDAAGDEADDGLEEIGDKVDNLCENHGGFTPSVHVFSSVEALS